MDTNQYTTQKCGTKPWLISTVAAFVVTMAFDWLVHGKLLMDMYNATADLWRSPQEMKALYPYCLAKHFLMAAIFSCMYGCWRSKIAMGAVGTSECLYRKSMKFGFWIGLLLGINAASAYIALPIPHNLALAWLVSEAVKWALVAGVLSYLARCSQTKTPV